MADASVGSSYLMVVPKFDGAALRSEADRAGSDAGRSIGDRISDGISAKAVVIGNVITDALRGAVDGAINIGSEIASGIYDGYAQNEQLVGGMKKLFGDVDYQTVVDNANNAFMTAGMSANDYMQNVTSFSASLINSLDGDTEAAAALADQAIQDMADNVNTFGTDAQSVQNAVMGLAKGNYSMLDNLSLGFAGNQQGMVDLINASGVLGEELTDTSQLADVGFGKMLEAIHAVQQDMGITGTTANEAMGTLEGSANAAKSAWENVLTAIGSGDSTQVETAASGLVDSLFGAINEKTGEREGGVVENLLGLAQRSFEALGAALPGMLDMALNALPPEIGGPLREAFESIGQVVETVAPIVSSAVGSIVTAVGQIAPVVAPLLPIIAGVMGAVKIAGVITTIVGAISGFITTAGAAIGMISGLPALISAVVTLLGGPITIIAAIVGAIVAFLATNEEARAKVLEVWEAVKTAVTDAVEGAIEFLTDAWNKATSTVSNVMNRIKSTFSNVWNSIKSTVSNVVGNITSAITSKFNAIVGRVRSIFNNVKSAITDPINTAKNLINSAIGKIKSIISGVKLQLPHINLPHFSVSGGKAPWGIGGKGSLPSFSVSWYAKGGYFDDPTLFAGVGERGGEFVWPSYAPYLDRYAEALVERMEGSRSPSASVVINGVSGPNEVARAVTRSLQLLEA